MIEIRAVDVIAIVVTVAVTQAFFYYMNTASALTFLATVAALNGVSE